MSAMLQLGAVRQRNRLVTHQSATTQANAGSILQCNLRNAQTGAFAPVPAFVGITLRQSGPRPRN